MVSPVGTVFPVIGQRIIILGMKALRSGNVSASANMTGEEKAEGRPDQGADNRTQHSGEVILGLEQRPLLFFARKLF